MLPLVPLVNVPPLTVKIAPEAMLIVPLLVNPPAPGFSVLLALIYSLLFSALWWGGWRQTGRDLLAGLVGFALGQLLGSLLDFQWLRVGEVQLLWGTVLAVLTLALGRSFWRPGRAG